MAEKVLVEIEVDEKGAVKAVNKLGKEVSDVSTQANKAKKSTTGLGKAFKGVGVAVKGVGAALKAAGIGLIIGLVSKFTEVLLENQTVMDGVNKVLTTLSIIVTQFTKPLFEVGEAITKNAGAFDALLAVGKSLLTIVLTPLKLGFIELQAIITGAQLLWEKSFLGDGDPDTIKKLEDDLAVLGEELLAVGEAALDAGATIGENIGEAFIELKEIATIASDAVVAGINNIDFAAAKAGANAIDLSKKRNALLELEQTRLRERFDLEAELQRQVRDDISKTIDLRIAANKELGDVLDRQIKAEQKSVTERIANIQLQNKLLGTTVERENEIFALQTELIAVNAAGAGFRSEQLTNENSLLIEQKSILQSKRDTEIEVANIQQTASAELLLSETDRIRAQIATEAELNTARVLALEERLLAEAEGTAAYQTILNERALLDANYNTSKQKLTADVAKADLATEKSLQEAKLGIVRGALGAAQSLAEEGSALAKGLAVAQVTFDTIRGIQSVFATQAANVAAGVATGGAWPYIQAASAAAFGFANVSKILSTPLSGGGGGGGGSSRGGGASGPSAPSVSQSIGIVAPNQGQQGIGQQIQDGLGGATIRAYAVGQDISNQQQLDRQIASNGSFG
jgi:hypothetical protein